MKREKGFTLIELMVVVVIIAILAGIALPRFMKEAERARESACWDTLTEMAKAIEMYEIMPETSGYPADLKVLKTHPHAFEHLPPKIDIGGDDTPDTPWSKVGAIEEYGYDSGDWGFSIWRGATYADAPTATYMNKGLKFRFP